MRYVAAYLLAVLGGNKSPSKKDITNILESVGLDVDDEQLNKVSTTANVLLDFFVRRLEACVNLHEPGSTLCGFPYFLYLCSRTTTKTSSIWRCSIPV